jgi:CRP/FNR family transcriptional regulator, cyclic AMP receptor protein
MAQHDELVTLLRQIELFQGVDIPELHLISQQMTEQVYDAGAVVFHEGDMGDRLFVILTGTMRVYVEREGKAITYALMRAGECFGEMALIEDAPRSATIRAEAPAHCLTLSKQGFLNLIQHHPQIALTIMKSLCQRLRHTNELLQHYAR